MAAAVATSSDAGYMMMSDGIQRGSATPRQRPLAPSSSSGRPRAPPSESQGAPSDDEGDGFEGDQIPGGARAGVSSSVPRVVDKIGIAVQDHFQNFIEGFIEDPSSSGAAGPTSSAVTTDKYYVAQIHGMRSYQLSTFYVDYKHLQSWQNGSLADVVMKQYYRFLPFLTSALHNMIAKYESQYFRDHRQPTTAASSTTASSNRTTSGASNTGGSQSEPMGSRTSNQQTDKLFALAFYNLPLVSRVRALRSANIGQLLSISGTVTRTSEVRPELAQATFVCEACRNVVPNVEQAFRYTEPTQCPNATCLNRMAWQLDIRQSTFVDWQKVRVQENSAEIPTGSMPRTMDVILRGEMVDRAKAGEKCIFTGVLIVVPDVSQLGLPGVRPTAVREDGSSARAADEVGGSGVGGLKALGVRDLTYRLAFLACMVTPDTSALGAASAPDGQVVDLISALTQSSAFENAQSVKEAQDAILSSYSPAEIEDLRHMVHSDRIYSRLVQSLAPMVYGHEIVKKGLLLQLVSGVSKSTPEGMQLRGDINICVVGDPSTSKSQFLKYVCSFAPRAVYTSGKASSAAGLTASVAKDEETGEFTIEAGALMLADNGICAIDEFDKMDLADQVAIHEAMEQQTISIAKAGIQATLNARTSILAAANPVGGRYDRKATLRTNINMSAPIMSRFDLFFVVLDECNEQVDRHLAEHIVGVHQLRDAAVAPEFSTEQLQRYIRFARTFCPEFTDDARELLVQKYQELRADDAQGGIGKNSYRITVRQLESMIRLSEAIAKVNCVEDITADFVNEAYNLLRQSIISVEHDDVDFEDEDDDGNRRGDADGDSPMAQGGGNNNKNNNDDDDEDEDDDDEDGDNNDRPQPHQPPHAEPKKTTITWDKYTQMVNLLVTRVAQNEADGEGVSATDLIQHYLESREDEIDTEAQYAEEQELCRKVLKRMVKEKILMAVQGQTVKDADAGAGPSDGQTDEEIVYVLHPNCAVEDV